MVKKWLPGYLLIIKFTCFNRLITGNNIWTMKFKGLRMDLKKPKKFDELDAIKNRL
jgi:hypothetical protein